MKHSESEELIIYPSTNIEFNKYDVGVIIARFQVPYLTEAHEALVNYVCSNHKKVVVLLGVSRQFHTKSNPLDYATREQMLKTQFPDVIILPVMDNDSDEEWSKDVDKAIFISYGGKSALLYGGRDSFIPYYSGRYKTVSLDTTGPEVSGTKLRALVSKELRNSADWRAGSIHAINSLRDVNWLTVDIIPVRADGKILLGKKLLETRYRFIGGFVAKEDNDTCIEEAAIRELKEESGLTATTSDLIYLGSSAINDPRYKGTGSGIMTTIFALIVDNDVKPVGDDDLDHVAWFDLNYVSDVTNIMPQHLPIVSILNKRWNLIERGIHVYEESLVALNNASKEK
jgi:bifunctional NMN adenylyltransferase/nudix hydrolase